MQTVEFKQADLDATARQYRREIIHMPLFALEDTTKYMTIRPGITDSERVFSSSLNAQLVPFRPDYISKEKWQVKARDLKVHLGTINQPFIPNEVYGTILGHRASQALGGGLQSTISAKDILCLVSKGVGDGLTFTIWTGKYDPDGETTNDLFDGFDTITADEIAAGNLSVANGNYIKLSKALTSENCCDVIKREVLYQLDPMLRKQKTYLFCSQEIADMYNDSYQFAHGQLPYNQQYEKTFVEGSGNLMEIVVMPGKTGSKFMHVATKSEMLVGCDQVSDKERVNVGKYSPDTLMFEMRAAFGVQFETLHRARMCAVEIAGE